MLRTDANTRMLAWDAKLREDSQTADIFSDFSGTMSETMKVIPEAVRVKVSGITRGEAKRTITMVKALSGAGVAGRTSQMGNEEEQTQKSLTVQANSYSNAVDLETYGIDAWEMSFYDIAKIVQPQLSRWHKETEGKHIREALCERYSSNLEVAPASLTPSLHPNIFIVDSDTNDGTGGVYPTYSATAGTYNTNVGTAIEAITWGATNRLTQKTLNDLIAWITVTKEIEPLNIGGKDRYILTVPSRQKRFLMDPTVTTSFGGTMLQADVRGAGNRTIAYEMREYGCLLLVEDPRSPIASSSTTVTITYKGAGSTDGRSLTGASDVCDVGFVLGKGALFSFDAEPLHFEEEIQDYGKNKGIGAFRTCGEIRADFDDVTPGATTIHNKSSAMVLFGTL